MKRYTSVNIRLLIVLFSLSLLSACVDTREALVSGERGGNRAREQVIMIDDLLAGSHINAPQSMTCRDLTRFGLIATLFSGITYVFTRYFESKENTTILCTHNDSSLAIYKSFIPIDLESMPIMLNALTWGFSHYFRSKEKNTTNLGVDKNSSLITSDLFMPTESDSSIMPYTNPNITIPNEKLIINATKESPMNLVPDLKLSNWVTDEPTDDGVTLENPMVLDYKVLNSLRVNDFSKKSIKYWLTKGLYIDAQDAQGRTLLMYGVEFCINEDAFQFIIDQGPNVNIQDNNGNTALHLSVRRGDCIDRTKSLLQVKNIDLNLLNHDGKTVLHIVMLCSYMDTLKMLVEINWLDNWLDMNIKDKDGNTPLCLAIKFGRVPMAEYLLTVPNIDLNATNNNKRTALHLAVKRGYLKIVKAILKNKVDINARDKDGNTPLHIAINLCRLSISKRLLEEKNIDLNVINNHRETVIHLAAKRNFLSGLRIILHKKIININARDKNGNTPFHLAISYGSNNVIDYLLTVPNIDLKAQNNNQETVTYLAAKKGYLNVIKADSKQSKIRVNV